MVIEAVQARTLSSMRWTETADRLRQKCRGGSVKRLQSLLIVAACLAASEATATGLLAPREHNRLVAEFDRSSMIFFTAKGPAEFLWARLRRWISAVGVI
jgi:hypothetical protein